MGDHPQFRLSAWFFVAGYGRLRRSKSVRRQSVVVSGTFVVQKGYGDMRLYTVSRGAI